MPLHPEAEQLLRAMREAGAPRYCELTPAAARAWMLERQRALTAPVAEVAEVAELECPGPGGTLRARRYRPSSAPPPGTIVYLHGGGWVVGGLDESDRACRALAVSAGCDLVSVDYRLAPEHPFPAAVDDAEAALFWVARNLDETGKLVVMGDSSGGNLATVTAIRARDRDGLELALQVLVYPVVDLAMDTPSYREHADGYPLGRADMDWFADHYAPRDRVDRESPELSPLRAANLSHLPPAVVVVAGHDPLRDEGIAYARALAEAGVEVTVERYDDMMHGFFTMAGVLSRADEAMAAVGAHVRAALFREHRTNGPHAV